MSVFPIYKNMTLKKKMLLIIILSIIIVGISSILAIRIIMNANNKLLNNSIAVSLSYSSAEVDSILQGIDTASSLIISDQTVQSNLSHMAIYSMEGDNVSLSASVRTIYNTLHSYQTNNKFISSIHILKDDTTISTSGSYPFLLTFERKDALINISNENKGKSAWYTEDGLNSGILLARSIREIKNLSLNTLGILVIQLNMDKIAEASSNFQAPFEKAEFILLDNDNIIYSSIESIHEEIPKIQQDGYSIINIAAERYFTVRGGIKSTGWNYVCLVPYSEVFHSITAAHTLSFSILLISILLAIIFAEGLFQGITKHFVLLVNKMNTFRSKNMELLKTEYDYSNRHDELAFIHNQFDSMAVEIQRLINDNYVNQLLIKDAKLKALETQINPHFLYNILESINWRSKAIGEKQISTMVEALGSLLRATLSKDYDDEITLEKEIEFVRSYITIQQIRFEDRLHFSMDLPDYLYHIHLPKLCVQPLVENAIHYSLEKNTDVCRIRITADSDKEHNIVRIYVMNDGSQFEDHLLDKLLKREIIPHGLGIGLLNIHSRIQLKFGKDYGLFLYNENENAIASIRLPFHNEE